MLNYEKFVRICRVLMVSLLRIDWPSGTMTELSNETWLSSRMKPLFIIDGASEFISLIRAWSYRM